MSGENSQSETSVSSEDGKQNEPLQTISTNILQVAEITDFAGQIDAISTRVDNLENKLDAMNDSINNNMKLGFDKLFDLFTNKQDYTNFCVFTKIFTVFGDSTVGNSLESVNKH